AQRAAGRRWRRGARRRANTRGGYVLARSPACAQMRRGASHCARATPVDPAAAKSRGAQASSALRVFAKESLQRDARDLTEAAQIQRPHLGIEAARIVARQREQAEGTV